MPGFALASEKFQGPLETLLDLIEARKMSVSDVSLAEVCDSYLAYVEQLPAITPDYIGCSPDALQSKVFREMPLSETSQFILIASTLLLIKSRTLLPTLELSQDERESVQELERRLARLRIIRQATKQLRARWGTEPLLMARKAPDRPPLFSPGEASTDSVFAAAKRLLATIPQTAQKLAEATVAPVVALEEVISQLRTRLSGAVRATWSEITRGADRHERIVHFLAILELVRSGSASATQDKLFGDIFIESEETGGAPSYGI
ncbi:segregation/condensation protein A [Candidatus Kaiserbacteria bacterium]|nr:segregation/condensation protein A [Candidatus Kaiserbacteria bacterium]